MNITINNPSNITYNYTYTPTGGSAINENSVTNPTKLNGVNVPGSITVTATPYGPFTNWYSLTQGITSTNYTVTLPNVIVLAVTTPIVPSGSSFIFTVYGSSTTYSTTIAGGIYINITNVPIVSGGYVQVQYQPNNTNYSNITYNYGYNYTGTVRMDSTFGTYSNPGVIVPTPTVNTITINAPSVSVYSIIYNLYDNTGNIVSANVTINNTASITNLQSWRKRLFL